MAATQKSFLESISPWPSRATTPKPDQGKGKGEVDKAAPPLEKSKGDDHTVKARHRLTRRDYPADCPKSNIRWFYAVDVGAPELAPTTMR